MDAILSCVFFFHVVLFLTAKCMQVKESDSIAGKASEI